MPKIRPFAYPEDQFVKMHNALFDIIMPVLPPYAWKILCVVVRETFGRQNKSIKGDSGFKELGYRAIADKIGAGSSDTVQDALEILVGSNCLTLNQGVSFLANSYRINPALELNSRSHFEAIVDPIIAKVSAKRKAQRDERKTKKIEASAPETGAACVPENGAGRVPASAPETGAGENSFTAPENGARAAPETGASFKEKDKEKDKDEEKKKPSGHSPGTKKTSNAKILITPEPEKIRERDDLWDALEELCKIEMHLYTAGRFGKELKHFRELNITADDVAVFKAWWYQNDFRGKRNEAPTMAFVRACWRRAFEQPPQTTQAPPGKRNIGLENIQRAMERELAKKESKPHGR
jgi:hypothetical protein